MPSSMAVYDSSVGSASRFDEDAGYSDEGLYQSYGRKSDSSAYSSQGYKSFEDANFSKEKPTWMDRTNSALRSTSSGVKTAGTAIGGATKKSMPVVKAGLGQAGRLASYSGSKMMTGLSWTKDKLTTKK